MTFTGELRPYQLEASDLIVNRGRALLALDLGTGKTIVSIHAIESLRDGGILDCALLIMSSSLTYQWAERIKDFTDQTHVVVIDGSLTSAKRKKAYEEALESRPAYVIMGIRQVVSDYWFVEALKPALALVDEVTSIKNFRPQQTKVIKKHVRSPYRVGLTAEPIENGKAEEVYSIMEWIDDGVFGDWRSFEADHILRHERTNAIVGYKNVPELHAKLMEACIVKKKDDADVADFMPTVEEFNLYVDMDDETRRLYDLVSRDLLHELYNAPPRAPINIDAIYSSEGKDTNADAAMGKITSKLLALQLLLDDPLLLHISAQAYEDPDNPMGSQYAYWLSEEGLLPPLDYRGAKLEACVEVAKEYLEEDPSHKVIIFARFKGVLPLLAAGLDKYGSVLFHGGLNGKQRGEAIEQFGIDPEVRLFLSSDAGGYGVDLNMASHLINYDLPQSSGALKQRNGRHVRANNRFRRVFLDNLIVEGSIEEYQLARLKHKARVGNAIMGNRGSDPHGRVENDVKSLTQFLKEYLGE